MKIRLLAVGRLKASPQADLCAEYLKRMKWTVTIKEIDTPKGASSAEEEPYILRALPSNAPLIALDERGTSLSSPDFARKLETLSASAPGHEICLLIGGADGLTDTIRKKSAFLLSFGKQTWPHMLVRVMLLEQVYRAQQILAGHPYHRA